MPTKIMKKFKISLDLHGVVQVKFLRCEYYVRKDDFIYFYRSGDIVLLLSTMYLISVENED